VLQKFYQIINVNYLVTVMVPDVKIQNFSLPT